MFIAFFLINPLVEKRQRGENKPAVNEWFFCLFIIPLGEKSALQTFKQKFKGVFIIFLDAF